MKTRSKNKMFSLALVAAMVVAMLPATIFAGATCPGGDACKHVAAIGDVHYDSLNEAVKEAKTGDEVLLLSDSKQVLDVNKSDVDFTINLNGKSIDASGVNPGDTVNLRGNNLGLTIKNGSIINSGAEAYGIYMYNDKANKKGYTNLNLVLDSVTINTGDQPLGVQGLNYEQNVTVRNCDIQTKTTAIYFPPKSGKLVIENSRITGVDNGVVVKGGEVVVKGKDTVITSTATPDPNKPPYTGDPTGNGFPQTGNPIYVEGGYRSDDGSHRPINVVIEDGKFESEKGVAVAANNLGDLSAQKLVVSGGIFSSDVTQFVEKDATVASLTSADDTNYYVGSKEAVADRLQADAKTGDKIEVKQGDLALDNLADKVSVSKGDNAGDVVVNGNAVGDEPVLSHVHKWGAPVWNWAKDYSKATAVFTCADDETHKQSLEAKSTKKVLVEPTADKDGKAEYTVSVQFDGKTYTDTKTVVIPAKGAAEAPNTGDSNIILPFAALLVSALGLFGAVALKRREN